MNANLEWVDLRRDQRWIQAYIDLRNHHADMLMTSRVDLDGTLRWLAESDASVQVLVEDHSLTGVLIIYPSRGGEVAVLAETNNTGVGTRLLARAEHLSGDLGIDTLWAWVRSDNGRALALFRSCRWLESDGGLRSLNGTSVPGRCFERRRAP